MTVSKPLSSFTQASVVYTPQVKFLFTTGGGHYRRPHQSKHTVESPVPVVIFIKHSCTQGWGSIAENGAKDVKSQRMREFAVRLCLLLMSEAAAVSPHQCVCPRVSGIRMTPGKMPNRMGQRHQLYIKTYRQPRKPGNGVFGFPREKHTN